MVINKDLIIQFGNYDNGSRVTDKSGIKFTFPITFKQFCNVIGQAWNNSNSTINRDTSSDIYYKTLSYFMAGWYISNSKGGSSQYFSYIAIGV